jgi:hypothetical protein
MQHAFVVQFAAYTGWDAEGLEGCIEPVVSGQATRFQSLAALLAFIAQVLEVYASPKQGTSGHALDAMLSPPTDT